MRSAERLLKKRRLCKAALGLDSQSVLNLEPSFEAAYLAARQSKPRVST